MTPETLILVGLFSAVASALLTWLLIAYCSKSELLDQPNDRSLHSVPVPRGGGAAIVAVVLTVLLLLAGGGTVPMEAAACIAAGTFVVAVVGWLDDRWGLSAGIRLIVHLMASALAVIAIQMYVKPQEDVLGRTAEMMIAPLLIVALAWSINLYNFMDGMDGLASSQAVVFGIFGAFFLWVSGQGTWAATLAAIAGAALGFLVWNRPKAKIFMGDVGSGALGFLVGVFTLVAYRFNPDAAVPMVILLAVFLVDATYTLIRRLTRGAKVQEAHRSHAYQKAVLGGRSHAQVLAIILLYQLAWLVPMAALAYTQPELAWVAAAAAGLPVLAAAISLKAGTEETAP